MTLQARTRSLSPFARCLPWAVAALTFGATATAQAGNPYEGEGAAIHGAAPATAVHSARSVQAASVSTPERAVAETTAAVTVGDAAAQPAPQRSDVRSSSKRWKQANIATPSGEVGDTAEVLKAREDFYALQTDVHETEYLAAAKREQALYAAQQALEDDALSEAGSDSFIEGAVALQEAPAEMPADERQIVVRPEMTIGELMSYLDDSAEASEVTVLMVSADEDAD